MSPAAPPVIISTDTARRLLLWAQRLLDDPDVRRATASTLRRTIHDLGFVQVDTINVLERAHHVTLRSRLAGYRPGQLDGLAGKRAVFEHWTHDASVIPIEFFPHWKHRFERYRKRGLTHPWWRERFGDNPDAFIRRVLKRVEREGPLRSADFERAPRRGGGGDGEDSGGWWGWKPDKAALEYLWRIGRLAISRREGFQKVYDLTERVYPEHAARPRPSAAEHVGWACSEALRRLVIATPAEIAGFWNAVKLPVARAWCREAVRRGRAIDVTVRPPGGKPSWAAVALPDCAERAARLEEAPRSIRLLSPFDPVLRDRRRLERLFGFDYRFEAFVPAPKRRYGYYVLPILEGDRLIGRLDPKLHRDRGDLEIKGLWWEPGVKPSGARRARLDAALASLAEFVGAERIVHT